MRLSVGSVLATRLFQKSEYSEFVNTPPKYV